MFCSGNKLEYVSERMRLLFGFHRRNEPPSQGISTESKVKRIHHTVLIPFLNADLDIKLVTSYWVLVLLSSSYVRENEHSVCIRRHHLLCAKCALILS